MTVLAVAAVLASGLGPPVKMVAAAVTVVLGLRTAWRFLRPSLVLRVIDDRLEYRSGRHPDVWQSLGDTASVFASPWFIGWRGRRGQGIGVFRSQLPPDFFRRMLVLLRQRGPLR